MSQENASSSWLNRIVGGRYAIVEKIAEGSHSQIFWGRSLLEDGNDAAIKVVAPGEEDPFISNRLNREGTILESIKNTPACPSLIDRHFTADGDLVLVLELLDGMSLEAILDRGDKRLDLDEVIELFTPVIETLSALHCQGIIHRDLHPGNFFRTWDPPGLKLLGFGEATFVRTTYAGDGERFCGIPKFVAPEVWEGKTSLDQRADVYSLAIVIFRCLAGRCPFEIESSIELIQTVPKATLPSLAQLAGLPAALDGWIEIALCPDRDGRFDNVDAMWNAFLRASHASGEASPSESERLRASA